MLRLSIFLILFTFFGCNLKVKRQHKQFTDYEKIRQELKVIHKADQENRLKLRGLEKKYGYNSDQSKLLWKTINKDDAKNLKKVTAILDKHGWLGTDYIGDGNSTLFLVIQHADLKTQEKYLPMMRAAAKNGDARKSSLALLEDRVLMGQGKQQLYGSQISRDKKKDKWVVYPIQAPENVDKRRTEMGLQSIADYVSYWDIEWDAEEHKKSTLYKELSK